MRCTLRTMARPDEDEIASLSALYEAERSDLSGLMGHALALIGVLIAYVGVASGVLGNERRIFDSWLFPAMVALPPWIAISFHVNLMANVFAHVHSVEKIEDRLYEATGLPKHLRRRIGSMAGDDATNIATQPWSMKVQTLVSYAGIAVLVVLFTVFCVEQVAHRVHGWRSWQPALTALLYTAIAISTVFAWRNVLLENDAMKKDPKPQRTPDPAPGDQRSPAAPDPQGTVAHLTGVDHPTGTDHATGPLPADAAEPAGP